MDLTRCARPTAGWSAGVTRAEDVCLRCHTVHEIEADERPVRWNAQAKQK
jgi:hypothetical protein